MDNFGIRKELRKKWKAPAGKKVHLHYRELVYSNLSALLSLLILTAHQALHGKEEESPSVGWEESGLPFASRLLQNLGINWSDPADLGGRTTALAGSGACPQGAFSGLGKTGHPPAWLSQDSTERQRVGLCSSSQLAWVSTWNVSSSRRAWALVCLKMSPGNSNVARFGSESTPWSWKPLLASPTLWGGEEEDGS